MVKFYNAFKQKFPSQKFLFLLYVMLFVSFSGNKVYASHASGSDLSYRWISGNIYEVTLNFYRDCQGVAAPNNVSLNVSSVSCGQNFNVTLNKISGTGQEITFPCNPASTYCNGGTFAGVQQYTYKGNVTLPTQCVDWVFSYSICCRSCAITTITNQSNCNNNTLGNSIYVEALLNNVAANHNSSPTFTNVPLAFVCANQTFTFNHGVIDINGDSLVYSFIPPKRSSTVDVGFLTGFSATNWITSSPAVTINSSTGDITMTPTLIGEVAVCAVLVQEYRNGIFIGSAIRDMQFWIKDCGSNIPPVSDGINGSNSFSTVVCPGGTTCFSISASDPNVGQHITMIATLNIPGATFTVVNQGGASPNFPVGTFCWTPSASDARDQPYTFTVMVRDDNCDYNAFQIYSYTILVPRHIITFVSPNYNGFHISCFGGSNGSVTANASGNQTPISYYWSTGATTQTVNGLSSGTYGVTITDVNGCTKDTTVDLIQPIVLAAAIFSTAVNCNGNSTGTANVLPSGGIAPYNYLWNNGGTTQSLTGLTGGNSYSVIISDANGCTTSANTTIIQPAILSVASALTNVGCSGASTGAVDLIISGGTSPYTYSWSNGATIQDLTTLTAGNYTVTVTDNNNCQSTLSITISQPTALTLSETHVNVLCNGNNTGSINLSVTGGTSPYTYVWSNGSTTQDLSGLTAGNYSVTVTDNNNCQSTLTITISQPTALVLSETHVNVLCNGNNTGSINLTVTGGTSPYTYVWSNGSTTQDLSGLTAGNYSVTVTDNNNCQSTLTITISQPTALVLSETHVNVLCNGNNTGSINLTVTGGTSPYTYVWSNGVTIQDLSAITAGSYTVTISDNNNCLSTLTIGITQPIALVLSEIHIDATCGTANGSINLTVSGGALPFNYSWNNGITSEDLVGITAGTYTVTVSDANNCTSTFNVNVNNTSGPILSETHVNVLCNGNNTGSINLTVTGGTAPYTYSWSNGSTTQDLTTLTAGNYSVTVTDNNNCQSTLTITISQPTALVLSETHVNVLCNGNNTGSINLTVTGGTSPYTYVWSNGSTTQDLSGLTAGNYSVTVTDNNNCQSTLTITISQPTALTLSETHVNVLCNGNNTGSINLTVTGGTAPYTYSWSNGSTTQDLTALSAGNYTVTVTDNNNCQSTLSITISQPTALVLSETHVNVLCNGNNTGSINLTVTGGTSPYTYVWSNGSTTQDLSGLTAGNYSVTVTDNNNCQSTLTITISQPTALVLSETHVNVLCNGNNTGSINLTVTGGTSPYTYSWSNGVTIQDLSAITAGSYTVTISDNNNCLSTLTIGITQPIALVLSEIHIDATCGTANGSINLTVSGGALPFNYSWNNGITSEDLVGITAGTYTVTVSDANNCTSTFNVNVNNTSGPILSETHVNVLCNGNNTGSINLTVTGGTSPYTYVWSNGSTTEDLTDVAAGNYTVTITDANGCTTTATVNLTQPQPLTATATQSQAVNCNGNATGVAVVTAADGTAPYTYMWSTASTNDTITGLLAATYFVTVTDAHGCADTTSVQITQPTTIADSIISITDINCQNILSGAVDIGVGGGTAPYTFNWSNGTTTEDLTGVATGTYFVTVTDANGCTDTLSAVVDPSIFVTVSFTIDDSISCNGASDGQITAVVLTSGTGPFSFLWTNGATTQTITGLPSGTYSVTVTDAGGCSDEGTVTLTDPATPNFTGGGTIVACGPDGVLTATLPTGYTGSWTLIGGTGNLDDATSPVTTVTGLSTGSNVFVWTITNGTCTFTDTATFLTSILNVDAGNDQSTCDSVNVQLSGSMSSGSGIWSSPDNGITFSNSNDPSSTTSGLTVGTNTIIWTVNDGSCTEVDTVIITVKPPEECNEDTLEMPTGFSPNGDGPNDFFVIHGLIHYPENDFKVFNRWGNLVYEKKNYNNEWDGTNNGGDKLPDGTYFVIFEAANLQTPLSGYVDMRR